MCTFFRQKLTTALLESAEGREWPQKIFHDQSPRKNVADLCGDWTRDLLVSSPMCAVIRSNMVYEHNMYSIVNTSTAASILIHPIAPEKSISQGPVVKNLTKLLANATLKLLSWNGKNIDIFCWKNVSSFCKSYSHFCSKYINVHAFENTLATIFNGFLINEIVKLTMLWTSGPW